MAAKHGTEPEPKKTYLVHSGIDYVVDDADHERVVKSFQDKDEANRIDPFDHANKIRMRRIEAGRKVSDLPERVVEALAKTKVEVDGKLLPVLEEVTDDGDL